MNTFVEPDPEQQLNLVLTNTLVENLPYVNEFELNTTRDNKSFFLIYKKIDEYEVGCEFTFKRNARYPRFECKKCRSLYDKDKKSKIQVTAENLPAAVTFNGNEIHEIKKCSHHSDCRVEFAGTALARSMKNSAVVYKSKYGGSSKQVYDSHSKILTVSGKNQNLTVKDFANGFATFEYAGSALKKSSKRKSAINRK